MIIFPIILFLAINVRLFLSFSGDMYFVHICVTGVYVCMDVFGLVQ